ncbi:D-isomer specific 2-hydroxyacid dehydrogenase [Aspergillus granulosus]|uniref:D-isomer specific 2-hydroxyacid dehydrogenase n=1 Tax=Aspergillus granulosus TaxID=176169 RepID=A0ABR4HW54_9EURO
MSKPKFAILDDYQGIAAPHFAHLEDRIDIAHFPETLDPRDDAQHAALIERLQPFDVILAMRERTPFKKDTLSQLPNLRLLLTTGTRNLSLDIAYLAERGIPVAGTARRPAGTLSTVQHTWALILALARHIPRDDAALKSGAYWQGSLGVNLAGKTLGIVGLGKLGSAVAKIAIEAFSMNVIAWSANLTQEKADQAAESSGLPKGSFRAVTEKLEFFARADVVSLHNVLSERSRGVVGKSELAAMKQTGLLVNTSRGPLIDEGAIWEVLQAGGIQGAAIDVFDPEPLPLDSPWRTTAWGRDGRSEVILSPHMGYGDEQIHGWLFHLSLHCPIPKLQISPAYTYSITMAPIAVQEPPSPSPTTLSPPATHPGLVRVVRSAKAFASGAYSEVSLPAGSLFAKITTATPGTKAYTSVQTGRDSHIELNSDLVFCNHSCTPSLNFDMHRMEVRVVEERPLNAGDALTFFYPSSEWEMDQPFQCTCGSGDKCKGLIEGAKKMSRRDLEGYWLNPHIEELLRERDAVAN